MNLESLVDVLYETVMVHNVGIGKAPDAHYRLTDRIDPALRGMVQVQVDDPVITVFSRDARV